jgi:hypothetical protein
VLPTPASFIVVCLPLNKAIVLFADEAKIYAVVAKQILCREKGLTYCCRFGSTTLCFFSFCTTVIVSLLSLLTVKTATFLV